MEHLVSGKGGVMTPAGTEVVNGTKNPVLGKNMVPRHRRVGRKTGNPRENWTNQYMEEANRYPYTAEGVA
jgi:hypothetical protein